MIGVTLHTVGVFLAGVGTGGVICAGFGFFAGWREGREGILREIHAEHRRHLRSVR